MTGSLRVTDTIYTTNETISSLTASAAVVSDANKKLVSRTILNNTSAAAVTGSDSLITANTLVNAGYVKSSGVTSITLTSGAGITVSDSGTAITNTGSRTISITGVDTSSGSETQCLTKKGTWKTFGTSNLTIGTTNSTAMAGNTVVNKVKTTATTDNVNYKILLNGAGASPTSGSDYEAVYSTNATFNTSSMLITTTKNNHTGDQGLVLDNTETNKVLKLGYIIGSSGNGGIYDYTHGAWKVKIATDGTTTFTGNLTGDVTGNCSGSSGSCTGNSATVTTAADTSNALYVLGVTSAATTTIKRNTSITMTGGTLTASTYKVTSNATIQYASTSGCLEIIV